MALTLPEIKNFVAAWYLALDQHDGWSRIFAGVERASSRQCPLSSGHVFEPHQKHVESTTDVACWKPAPRQ